MKKLLLLALALMLIVLCCMSCGEETQKETTVEEVKLPTAEEIAGSYVNVGAFPMKKYTLNENTSYIIDGYSTPDEIVFEQKGKFIIEEDGGITLVDGNGIDKDTYSVKDDYYYRTSWICSFDKDGDFGLNPSFDDSGRAEQDVWFAAYYDSAGSASNVLILMLNADGSFKMRDCLRGQGNSYQTDGIVYEGQYVLEDYVLKLNYEGGTMELLFIDDAIYFDVLKKV